MSKTQETYGTSRGHLVTDEVVEAHRAARPGPR